MLICVKAFNLVIGITKYVAFGLVRVRFRCVLYQTVLQKVAKEAGCLHGVAFFRQTDFAVAWFGKCLIGTRYSTAC
jgi:hypothetical protein